MLRVCAIRARRHATLSTNKHAIGTRKGADLVFTGGYSLYEAKCQQHSQVYAFPSSVDTAHFSKAREVQDDPSDQASIPHLRLGFYGVIDERFDIDLLRAVADRQPDWHFILIGPIVKISPDVLPQGHNIHYLGEKNYNELPSYLEGNSGDLTLPNLMPR